MNWPTMQCSGKKYAILGIIMQVIFVVIFNQAMEEVMRPVLTSIT